MMKIFMEMSLGEFLRRREQEVRQTIKSASQEALGAPGARFVDALVRQFQLAPLVFHWGKVETSSREEKVSARDVPGYFGGYPGQQVNIQVITFHLPYEGNFDLLRCQPSSGILWSMNVVHYGKPKEITFDVYNCYNDPKRVEDDAKSNLNNIRTQADNVNREVEQYNDGLLNTITEAVRARREVLQKQTDTLQAIGFPVRR